MEKAFKQMDMGSRIVIYSDCSVVRAVCEDTESARFVERALNRYLKEKPVPRERHGVDQSLDWPEEFDLENGYYSGFCHRCKREFYGNKGRLLCKSCHVFGVGDVRYALWLAYRNRGLEVSDDDGTVTVTYPSVVDGPGRCGDFVDMAELRVSCSALGPSNVQVFRVGTEDAHPSEDLWVCKNIYRTAYTLIGEWVAQMKKMEAI